MIKKKPKLGRGISPAFIVPVIILIAIVVVYPLYVFRGSLVSHDTRETRVVSGERKLAAEVKEFIDLKLAGGADTPDHLVAEVEKVYGGRKF